MRPTAFPDVWITESNTLKQTVAAVVMVAIGGILAIGLRHVEGPGLSDGRAGFLLGLLLLAIGLAALLFGGKQVITVDARRRRIVIKGRNGFGSSAKVVRFNEIAEVYVEQFGSRKNGSISYPVVAKLKTGKTVYLFFAFYDGQHDKSMATARCQRLAQYLQASR